MFELSDLLASQGHEVIPFSMVHENNESSEYAKYFVSNIEYSNLINSGLSLGKYFKATGRLFFSYEAIYKIRKLIRATKPDIAHIHGVDHQLSPSILTELKRSGIPIVQTLHDYKLLCPNTIFFSGDEICEMCKGGRYYQVIIRKCKRQSLPASFTAGICMYFHKLIRIFEKNVDLFISPSQFLIEKFREHGLDIPITYLPNFINIDSFSPSYHQSDYFLYSGRLSYMKGLSTLIEAMKQVKSHRLLIAGDGDMKDEIEWVINKEKNPNIRLLGFLSTDELVPIIKNAAFTVIPSLNFENCPMVVLESFACGTSVLGSNLGGIPEFIHEGHNGMLFEPGNSRQLAGKINSLFDNLQKTSAMGHNGRQDIERWHNPHKYYRSLMSIYKDLVDRNHVGVATGDIGKVNIN